MRNLFKKIIPGQKVRPGSLRLPPTYPPTYPGGHIMGMIQLAHFPVLAFIDWKLRSDLKFVTTLFHEHLASFAPSCPRCSIFISTILWYISLKKWVSNQLSCQGSGFQVLWAERPHVFPLLVLMGRKEASKVLLCSF